MASLNGLEVSAFIIFFWKNLCGIIIWYNSSLNPFEYTPFVWEVFFFNYYFNLLNRNKSFLRPLFTRGHTYRPNYWPTHNSGGNRLSHQRPFRRPKPHSQTVPTFSVPIQPIPNCPSSHHHHRPIHNSSRSPRSNTDHSARTLQVTPATSTNRGPSAGPEMMPRPLELQSPTLSEATQAIRIPAHNWRRPSPKSPPTPTIRPERKQKPKKTPIQQRWTQNLAPRPVLSQTQKSRLQY